MLNNGFSGKFAIRNVESLQLFDTVTGLLFAESYNLKTGPVNQTVDINYASGGQGNSRIAAFKSNKNIEIAISNALFDVTLLGEQSGTNVEEATDITYDAIYTTTVADTATVDHALATGGDITVEEVTAADNKTPIQRFTQVASSPATGEYSIAGTTISFFAGDVPIGSFIRVIQDVTTTQSITKITSYANDFAGTYRAVLIAPIEDLVTSKTFIGEITIFRANVSENLNLAFQNDGEVAVHDAMLSGLANVLNKKLWELKVYDDTDLA